MALAHAGLVTLPLAPLLWWAGALLNLPWGEGLGRGAVCGAFLALLGLGLAIGHVARGAVRRPWLSLEDRVCLLAAASAAGGLLGAVLAPPLGPYAMACGAHVGALAAACVGGAALAFPNGGRWAVGLLLGAGAFVVGTAPSGWCLLVSPAGLVPWVIWLEVGGGVTAYLLAGQLELE